MTRQPKMCFLRAALVPLCIAALGSSARCDTIGDSTTRPPFDFTLSDFSVVLERAYYQRECPRYTVTVRGDGTGECECRGARGGTAEQAQFAVSRESVLCLIRAVNREDFYSLESPYTETYWINVDGSGVVSTHVGEPDVYPGSREVFTVTMGQYTKTIVVLVRTPPCVLERLRERIDELAGPTYALLVGEKEQR